MKFGPATRKILGSATETVKRAASAAAFKGKHSAALDILAPAGLKIDRMIVVGTGKDGKLKDEDVVKIQAFIQGTADAIRPKK